VQVQATPALEVPTDYGRGAGAPVESVSGLSKSLGAQANQIVLLQRVRVAMAGIVITEMLSELCLKPARDTGEKQKTSSPVFRRSLGGFRSQLSPAPGLGVYEVPTTLLPLLLHCARSCFRKKSWRGAHVGAFLDCRGSSVGRVPKAWFDI
jgi:hypothetical protein